MREARRRARRSTVSGSTLSSLKHGTTIARLIGGRSLLGASRLVRDPISRTAALHDASANSRPVSSSRCGASSLLALRIVPGPISARRGGAIAAGEARIPEEVKTQAFASGNVLRDSMAAPPRVRGYARAGQGRVDGAQQRGARGCHSSSGRVRRWSASRGGWDRVGRALTPSGFSRFRATLHRGDELGSDFVRRLVKEGERAWAELAQQRVELAGKAARSRSASPLLRRTTPAAARSARMPRCAFLAKLRRAAVALLSVSRADRLKKHARCSCEPERWRVV